MSIIRNPEQGGDTTLETFYQEVAERERQQQPGLIAYYPGVGQPMLLLIERINELFKDTELWGETSHSTLIVQQKNCPPGVWSVYVAADGFGNYSIEYLLPTAAQPWPGAFVRGGAETLKKAEHYLLIAMHESGCWVGNSELAALLESYAVRG